MKTKIFCILAVLLFVVSCKDDSPQTLTLNTPQQIDNSIILNWEQSEVSGFQYYAVMRASDGQNYTIINDIVNPTSDAFRKNITTFTDTSYPIEADTLYYKIMAVGDETVLSKNVLYRNVNKAALLRGDFRQAYYIEEENKLSVVVYDNSGYGYKLKVFDLQSGKFLPNEATINLSNSGCWYLWGKYNGKTEFYNYDSDWTMYVYDAATARQITTLRTPSSVWYDPYTTNNKGMIYIYSYYLYCINRATGTYTQYQPTNQMYWADYLYYNSKNNKLYAIDESNHGRIFTFNLNADGSVASDEVFTISGNSGTPIFIENSSLFIVNTNGQTKVLDMNTKMYHTTDLTTTSYYYNDTKAILAGDNIYIDLSNGIISIGMYHTIYKISTSDYKISQTIALRAAPIQMFVSNGYLYYLGQYDYNTYLLDKIKL
ncbi:MAG: PQQ-like beta-propeller repeat protein [Candidatus Azobacteroides sp.]|nr:PQQ-like beta-propeller repeat protein [Candidatus Azobacteroides sp.]